MTYFVIAIFFTSIFPYFSYSTMEKDQAVSLENIKISLKDVEQNQSIDEDVSKETNIHLLEEQIENKAEVKKLCSWWHGNIISSYLPVLVFLKYI